MADEIIDAVGAAADVASGVSGDGFGPFVAVIGVLGLICAPFACLAKKTAETEGKIINTITSPMSNTSKKPDESIPHWLGRKTKDSVIDFGKGIIGK